MSNPPPIMLEPAPPETPRTRSAHNNISNIPHGLNRLSTPLFPFGLSFSPTFNFNTPNGISPTRFFTPVKAADSIKNNTPLASKDHFKFLASLNSISQTADAGHQSSELNSEDNQDKKDESEEDDDVWSSLNATQQNQSNLTSIHESDLDMGKFSLEEGDSKIFQTPAKLLEHKTKPPQVKLIPSVPTQAASKRDGSSIARIESSVKRRKLSNIADTPNNRIAARIDSTMDSPVSMRRLSNAHSTTSSSASEVWSLELDDVLIKSFHKYHKFKLSDAANELSILKKTSQNKVISRMIFNRTGILRTSKQISSRIFRLSKAGRLTKETKTPQTNVSTSELEELIRTPLEELVNGQHLPESAHTDALIDQELNILLTSSPLDEVFDTKTTYKLTPKDFKMCFHDQRQTITFTRLGKQINNDNKSLEKLDLSIVGTFGMRKIPVWLLKHDLNLHLRNLATSTPLSQSWSPYLTNATNLNPSGFESIMTIDVYCEGNNSQPMLAWYSSLEVYKSGKKLLLVVDIINGYRNEDSELYTLKIPFAKTFFAGFINYLINGSAISSDEDLKIVQLIYDNVDESNSKLDLEKSHIHAYLVHDFHMCGTKGETVVKIVDSRNIPTGLESDDNETVVAGSSPPCRLSSTPPLSMRNKETPSKLKIDINRANNNHNILSGPLTAPVYNSSVVNKLNRNTLEVLQRQSRFKYAHEVPPSQPMMDPFATYRGQSQSALNSSPEIHSNDNNNAGNTNIGNMQLSLGVQQSNVINNMYQLPAQGGAHIGKPAQPQVQASYSQQQFQFHPQQIPQVPLQFLHPSLGNISVPLTGNPPSVPITARYQSVPTQPILSFQSVQPHNNNLVLNTNATRCQLKQHLRPQPSQTHNDKENKAKEITFGPILGYDPSKDAKITRAQIKPTNQGKGIHTFPLNEPVMYKPKK